MLLSIFLHGAQTFHHLCPLNSGEENLLLSFSAIFIFERKNSNIQIQARKWNGEQNEIRHKKSCAWEPPWALPRVVPTLVSAIHVPDSLRFSVLCLQLLHLILEHGSSAGAGLCLCGTAASFHVLSKQINTTKVQDLWSWQNLLSGLCFLCRTG